MRKTNSTHPLKTGDVVAVITLDPAGCPIIEGAAVIKAKCALPNRYRLRFRGELTLCSRFVSPEWQKNPARSLALLVEFWWASKSPPAHEEFFPDTE
jgi:hypothetical protein